MPAYTPTSSEFFIEKRRMPVALTLQGGAELEGELFIQASHRVLATFEDAGEFMNSAEPFFPLRAADGSTRLVAKSQVVSVDAPLEFTGTPDASVFHAVAASVQMSDGAVHRGSLYLESIVAHTRVLDFINKVVEPFISLQVESGIRLLNRHHILFIRPEDDAAA